MVYFQASRACPARLTGLSPGIGEGRILLPLVLLWSVPLGLQPPRSGGEAAPRCSLRRGSLPGHREPLALSGGPGVAGPVRAASVRPQRVISCPGTCHKPGRPPARRKARGSSPLNPPQPLGPRRSTCPSPRSCRAVFFLCRWQSAIWPSRFQAGLCPTEERRGLSGRCPWGPPTCQWLPRGLGLAQGLCTWSACDQAGTRYAKGCLDGAPPQMGSSGQGPRLGVRLPGLMVSLATVLVQWCTLFLPPQATATGSSPSHGGPRGEQGAAAARVPADGPVGRPSKPRPAHSP